VRDAGPPRKNLPIPDANPKTDLVSKRIFGAESHKHLLIELLNALLEPEGSQRIVNLEQLSPEQHVAMPENALDIARTWPDPERLSRSARRSTARP
jgi:hypothetical protein